MIVLRFAQSRLLTLALLLAACNGSSGASTTGGDSRATRSSEAPAPAASSAAAVEPGGGFVVDAKIGQELDRLGACLVDETKTHSDCDKPSDDAFAVVSNHWDRAAAESLLAALDDPSVGRRRAAGGVLSRARGALGLPDAFTKDPRALALLRRRFAVEKDAHVVGHLVWLMGPFGPTRADAEKIVAWVNAQPEGEARTGAMDEALGTLTPTNDDEPVDGAVNLALVRVRGEDGLGRPRALALLVRAKARASKDVCAAIEKVVRAGEVGQFWIEATIAATQIGEPCRAAIDAGVDALVPVVKKGDVIYLSRVATIVRSPAVSAAQRKKIAGALPPSAKNGPDKDDADAIVEAASH